MPTKSKTKRTAAPRAEQTQPTSSAYDRLRAAQLAEQREKRRNDLDRTWAAALAYYQLPEDVLRGVIVANWLESLNQKFPTVEMISI